ncbi:PAS domain-containing protein [haloarchaeon 3A1-DGR]|nr:PAS domain-containing protein [haloarchaeon 3A1-DGR]
MPSDDRLELALERTDSVLFEIDADSGAVTHVGDLERLFGVADATIPTWESFREHVVHPTDVDAFERSVRRILSGEIDEDSIEYRIRVDGEVRWIGSDVYAEPDPESGRRRAVGIARDVTDRKEREQSLERVRDFFTEAERLGDLGAWEVGADGTVVWTAGTRRIHGVEDDFEPTLEEAIEFFHPADRETVRSAVETALEAGDGYDLRARLIDADGEIRWVRTRGEVVDDEGTIRGYIQDVTDQHERETELRRATAQLEAAIEAGAVGTWEWDVESNEIVAGAAFADLFGIDPEAAAAGVPIERFLEAVHENDRPALEHAVEEALNDCGPFEAEYRVRNADGEIRWVVARGHVECDADGTPTRFPGAITDITDRKRRERELETLSEFLQGLYDVTTDPDSSFEEKIDRLLAIGCAELDLPYGFLTRIDAAESASTLGDADAAAEADETVADADGPIATTDETIVAADDAAVDVDDVVVGPPPDDRRQTVVRAHGTHPELQPGESCPLSEAYCRKTIETPDLLAIRDAVASGWEGDPAYERFDLGSYVGGKVIVDGELYGTLCFAATNARDRPFSETERSMVRLLTKWTSYELERRRSTAELRDRNERLERFASIVSHDLRNPLNVAIGRLDLAMEADESDATADEADGDTGDDRREDDDRGEDHDRREDDDRRNHLAAIERSLDRMDALITDLLTLARQGEAITGTESVTLADCCRDCWATVETAAADLSVRTDAVVRADRSRVTQLLENLFRNAVEHGGRDVTITVGVLPDGDGFYVADDGPGIPETERDHVFEAGHSTADDGTGFGLSIVREIATAHGWNVRVVDADSGGARFEFTGVDVETPREELPADGGSGPAARDGESTSEE